MGMFANTLATLPFMACRNGGTGALGQVLVRRLLEGETGPADEVTEFSRCEATQHAIAFQHRAVATSEIVYEEGHHHRLQCRVCDVPRPCVSDNALIAEQPPSAHRAGPIVRGACPQSAGGSGPTVAPRATTRVG